MRKYFHQSLTLVLIASFVVFSGCSPDEKTQVRNYNNQIFDIETTMLQRNQDAAKVLITADHIDPQKALAQMEKVLADVQKSSQNFEAIQVPKGAENLAQAMKNLFQVETAGVSNIIDTLKILQQSPKKSATYNDLLKKADDFSKKENDALQHFVDVQRATAIHYGEKVEESGSDTSPSTLAK